jgi:hypothetical protein
MSDCLDHSRAEAAVSPPGKSSRPPVRRTWHECAHLHESGVPLARLDPAVRFDDDFPAPIRYDEPRGQLLFRGLMSHASYLHLRSLSSQPEYQLAIERLFLASATPPAARPKWSVWGGLGAAAAITAAALVFLASGGREADDLLPGHGSDRVTAGGDPDGDGTPLEPRRTP